MSYGEQKSLDWKTSYVISYEQRPESFDALYVDYELR